MTSPRWLLVGIMVGATGGLVANALAAGTPELTWIVDNVAQPIGQVFLRLIFMVVVPLIFSAVVTGVGDLELRQLGRVGLRTIGYTIVVSAIAVAIGLVLVNVLQPGAGLPDEVREAAKASKVYKAPAPGAQPTGVDLLVGIIPDNPAKAAATGDMIGVLVFALFFGVALALTTTVESLQLRAAIKGLFDVCMRIIEFVFWLAPLGIGALIFAMMARLGLDILWQLASYVGVVLLGLSLHMFVVYPLSVYFFGGRNPIQFFRDVRLAILTAFATASSNATLPTSLKVAEENLKLPRHVARFVLTAGSTMNQNGTALFEGVTTLFLAQLFGVDLTLGQQGLVMIICVLGGIGTAGVPAGSIPVVAMILGMFAIPVEGLGLILGVDRLLDMCRTTLNVTGDLAAAVYVARGEPVAEATPTTEVSSAE